MKQNNFIKRFWRGIKDRFTSSILCIRFPFLYPRNRFSGLHHHNYKFGQYISKLYSESVNTATYTDENDELHISKEVTNYFKLIWYYIANFVYEWAYQLLFCIPKYTELDAMPDGWRNAFGIQMCKDIKKQLIKEGGYKLLFAYRIMQIKEKFGTLRWYDSYSTTGINGIIRKYEDISAHTCINCGKPATWISKGWISPYCDDCIGNTENAVPINKVDEAISIY